MALHSNDGPWLKDEHGRTLILRGVNLGGSSKVPRTPDGATHRLEHFFDHRHVSFVGRPFPLAEADEHFTRLRHWGFTMLRFLITWEAIEHAGPGLYDQDYLDYLYAVVARAGTYGFLVWIDMHQDVWSRFSGGDGAPGWTLEAVGLDITQFAATGAAIVHATHGDPFPGMIWPTNGWKLAAATMFTLFFGGNDVASATTIDGEPVQEYLQRHYIAALQHVAARLCDLPHVIGYDPMNEPMSGFLGCRDLSTPAGPLELGRRPSVFQAMALGAGHTQQLEIWDRGMFGPKRIAHQQVNPHGQRAWRAGYDCVWRQNGVWDLAADQTPRLLRPQHFCFVRGRWIDFAQDYYRPFINRAARAIRAVHPAALVCVENEITHLPPRWGPDDAAGIMYAPHWYDAPVLFTKTYSPWIGFDLVTNKVVLGPRAIRRSYASQVAALREQARTLLGNVPTLIGEFGIPFDMHERRAYRSGSFARQEAAMDRSFRAIEDALLSATIWNYTADNTNERGDQWNGEDLSIFSRDQQQHPADINSGGRALRAVLRPYACRIAGEALQMHFDMRRRVFRFAFRHDPAVHAATELFVPDYQFPTGYRVEISDGSYRIDRAAQTVYYRHSADRATHEIRISPLRR